VAKKIAGAENFKHFIMLDYFFEQQMRYSIEEARKSAELRIRSFPFSNPVAELEKTITEQFSFLNLSYQNRINGSTYIFLENIKLDKIYNPSKKHHFGKSIIGSSLVFAGQPILKKRFVMAGSSAGTSIASNYLSKAFPQVMPQTVLGTRVFGRALGRAVPYIGWALLAIDVIELIIEENQNKKSSNFNGFGGGSSGGGGATGNW
jgi:hypothetical protein